jgi:hypothetical protein
MSLQMVVGGSSSSSSPGEPHLQQHAVNVVPLSHVTDLSQISDHLAAAAAGHQHNSSSSQDYDQLLAGGSLLTNAADDDALAAPGMLPMHPPGDSTPSSVVSSRAGLNWSIPSRGGTISPCKPGAYSPLPMSPSYSNAGGGR